MVEIKAIEIVPSEFRPRLPRFQGPARLMVPLLSLAEKIADSSRNQHCFFGALLKVNMMIHKWQVHYQKVKRLIVQYSIA